MTAILFSSMGCDEGMQMVDDVMTAPVEQTEPTAPKPADSVAEVPTTTGDIKKPQPVKPADTNPEEPEPAKPEPEEPELEPADTTVPTVVEVGWYAAAD
ncbi:hypothetical protein F4141_23690 [Candidatus Poribacteria bacterium]|nr:hypothetical protein [Candidatus Poribacteria bacterium]